MPYDRESFLSGIAVGRNMKSWPKSTGNLFAFLIEVPRSYTAPRIMIKTGLGVTLNYGDGRTTDISSSPNWTTVYLQRYQRTGEYIVTITGDLTDFKMSYSYSGNTLCKRVLTPFPKSMSRIEDVDNTFSYCTHLESVPSNLLENCRKIKTANGTFSNCSRLTIPQGLFAGCSLITSFETTFVSVGSNIPSQSIPSDLFSGCSSAQDFYWCFRYANIRAVPLNLFDGTPFANNFSGTFACSTPTITSKVPELWDQFPNAVGSNCYYNQTLIDGYESIPSGWK